MISLRVVPITAWKGGEETRIFRIVYMCSFKSDTTAAETNELGKKISEALTAAGLDVSDSEPTIGGNKHRIVIEVPVYSAEADLHLQMAIEEALKSKVAADMVALCVTPSNR